MRSYVLSAAIAVAVPGMLAAQSFEAGQSFPALEHPNSVAVADMNGDGRLDLVVPSWSPNRLAVYLADGAGGFATATTYPTGTGPRYAAIGDFNSDGHPDVATANSESGTVSLFFGSPTGTLAAMPHLTAGATAHHVAVGDLNADGKADLVVANAGAASVSVFFGNGAGGFSPATTLPAGAGPRATAMADFDLDGNVDLAVSNYASNDVWIFPGTGGGGFGTPVAHPVGTSPFTLAAADLDGDADVDLVVPNFGAKSLSVLRNDGAGGFVGATLAVGLSPRAVVVADLDGDGFADLAVANRDNNTVGILSGDGAGGFGAPQSFGVGSGPFHLVVADLDGDGRLDVVTPDRDSYSVTVLLGSAGVRLSGPRAYKTGTGPRGLELADLNGDGRADLITADTAADTASVSLGAGDGTLLPAQVFAVGRSPYAVVAGDFNGDGLADLATANSGANKVSVLRAVAAGGFLPALNSSAGSGPRALVAQDFNADGRLDLATANFGANTVGLLLGTGTGSFAAPVALPAGTGPAGVVAADWNGDGRPDLATANSTSNNVSILLATGPGTFAAASQFAAGTKPSSLDAGDLDGDGQADLTVANETSNNVSVLLGNGAGGFVAAGTVSVCTRPLGIVLHELTGDDHLDVAVACATTNNVAIAAGHGDGTFEPALAVHGGVFARAVAAGDLNGDGRADLAIANQNSNDLWVVVNRSGPSADLAVSASNGASSVLIGSPVSYAVGVTNLGPSDVGTVQLTVTLPAGLEGASYSPSAGEFDEATGEWTGLDLAAGDEAILTVSGTVAASAAGSFSFTAVVAPPTGTTDPAGGNDTATDVDPVIRGDADLAVVITNGATTVAAGDPVTYTVIATNAGPTDALGVGVSTALPATLVGATWTCTGSGGTVCAASGTGAIGDAADLPAGAQATYTLHATVDPLATTGTLTVSAQVQAPSDIHDPNPANDAASDSDALQGNAPPVPNPQSVSVPEDGSVPITLTASDPDGDPLTFAVETAPAHGVLTGVAPDLVYTPAADYFGPDSFTFSAHDGIVAATATVSLTVLPVNDPPQAFGQSLSTDEDVSLGLTLGASDADGDPLTYTVVTPPALGALTGAGASRTYTPLANTSGSDGFTFTVSDGQVSSAPATVTLSIAAVNDAPTVASPIADLTVEGEATSATVELAGVFDDVESGPAGLALSSSSSNPALVAPSLSGTTLTLQLAPGQSGTATVTVRATDPGSAFVEDVFVVSVVRPGVRVSVSDASRGEGSSSGVVFTLSLSAPAPQPVTVGYATADGTAVAPADYGALSGTVTFAAGVTTRTVKVTTVSDVLDEDDEVFTLVLGSAVGAAIEDGVGVGTIVDNDTSGLSVLDISVAEGNAGQAPATFTVSLSTPSARDITVDFATMPVSASPGVDYVPLSGSLTFPAGSTAAQTVAVAVAGDLVDEPNEAFSLQLSGVVNAVLTRGLARATITDDDAAPSVTAGDVSLTEGASGVKSFVFTFTLSAPSAFTTRVQYATANGTAVAGSDYTARTGEIVFAPGSTTATVAVAAAGDASAEPDETFFLDLHTPINLTIGDAQAIGTILNDD